MTVIWGTHRFRRQLLGFRLDYCLACEDYRRSFLVRSFDAFHLFFLPIFPLGFRSRWECGTCGSDPHRRVKTSRPMLLSGAALLAVFAIVLWSQPVPADQETVFWVFRIGLPAAAFVAVVTATRRETPTDLERLLDVIDSGQETECPSCSVPLIDLPDWHCPSCGLKRFEVDA